MLHFDFFLLLHILTALNIPSLIKTNNLKNDNEFWWYLKYRLTSFFIMSKRKDFNSVRLALILALLLFSIIGFEL